MLKKEKIMTSKEFVNMAVDGNNIEMDNAFKDAISDKITNALDTRRKEIAASFVNTKSNESEI
jgi:ribosome-associated translation inhibitor RaiA|tara:strand:+ start:362 stop:550 length:189 start_codon:yes stop_codon:yes gene_type:complete